MKTILTLLFIVISTVCLCQNEHTFKIKGINEPEGAKRVTEVLRKTFLVNPTFNDVTDTFSVPGTQNLVSEDLSIKMLKEGYIITDFKAVHEIKIENK